MKNRVWRGMIAAGGLLCVAGLASMQAAVNVPRFSGNSYINLGTPTTLQLPSNDPFTIEAWVRVETLSVTAMVFSKGTVRPSTSYNHTHTFGLTGTGTKMAAYTGNAGDPVGTWREATLPATIAVGTWHHLAYSFDGAYLYFFYDGVQIGVQPYSFGNYTAHIIKIGGYANDTDLQGNISDVRVWTHARSAAQVAAYRNRRLTGTESGLLGYWRLNEGTGTKAEDGTTANNDGTLNNVTWATTTTLNLAEPDPGYTFALPFTMADIETGSTRFTNSNKVEVASLPFPEGCDYYQFTQSGDVAAVDPGGWSLTNATPPQLLYSRPATDTNITFYAWFTNSTVPAIVHRATGAIYYTTVLPAPSVRATLTRQKLPGENVIISGSDLDSGSTGGVANNTTLAVFARDAIAANPADNQTPDESFVTLNATGVYPLLLRVWNEAGNAAMGVATCQVTITAYTGTNLWTGGGSDTLWHNGANWSAGVPASGQDVAIRTGSGTRLTGATAQLKSFVLAAGRTVTVAGWTSAIQATELQIQGIVTHEINDVPTRDGLGNWTPQHRILLNGSNVTVASGAILNAEWKGYRKGQGPGSSIYAGSGAGHAGEGGYGDGTAGGNAVGEIGAPTQPGSGGGIHASAAEGGGAIRIDATGRLTILGTLKANGHNSYSTHGPAGAGGSIWLSCRTLAGSSVGLVQVKGGDGNYYGGGGAGGRIAVDYDSSLQAALPDPRPAIRFDGTPGVQTVQNRDQRRAGMGTLFLPDTLLIENNFAAKRLQYVQVAAAGWSQWVLGAMTISDCVIGVQEGVDLVVTNNLTLTNSAALHLFAGPVTNVLTDIGATLSVGGSLRLPAGTWIMPTANPTNGAVVKVVVDGDLHVAAGAGFDADFRGYTRGYGPGKASDGNSGSAGHGGMSGMSYGGRIWGIAYDDPEWPTQAGSGGFTKTLSGRGGGAIRLEVNGKAVIHGTLTAKGAPGGTTHGGAGSGGTILLQCNTLEGSNSGLLSVDGGQGNYYGACGGGGRIAVHYDPASQAALAQPVPPIRISAYAYPFTNYQDTKFTINAQVGTLWLPNTLFITENLDLQRFWHLRLVIPGFSSWAPAGLTVNNCALTWPEGFTLTVANDLVLTNGASMTLIAAATNSPSQRFGAQLVVGRDLVVAANSWIYPQAHPTNAAIVGLRVGRNATLAAGGGIDAAGRGFHASNVGQIGPGEGANQYNGGGYGGKGGGTAGGVVYGRAALPLLPGSAAGWNGYGGALGYTVGGNGGGAVHLRVGGELRVDGLVTADGWHGSYHGGSGGSGGAILLAAQRVVGSGTVRAKGGLSNQSYAAGGGGRIAIWHHMTLGDVEARLAAQSSAGLRYTTTHPDFTGTLDVGWYGTSTQGLPGEGSKGFYTQVSTLIIIR